MIITFFWIGYLLAAAILAAKKPPVKRTLEAIPSDFSTLAHVRTEVRAISVQYIDCAFLGPEGFSNWVNREFSHRVEFHFPKFNLIPKNGKILSQSSDVFNLISLQFRAFEKGEPPVRINRRQTANLPVLRPGTAATAVDSRASVNPGAPGVPFPQVLRSIFIKWVKAVFFFSSHLRTPRCFKFLP